MTIYRVENGVVTEKPIITTRDLADLVSVHPIDLDSLELDTMSLVQESVPTIHWFAPGIYIREVRLPAGVFAIGHKHKGPHLNVMLTGRVTMESGEELVAPFTSIGMARRKGGTIHEDTVWLNIYATDEQDIGTLEDMFIEKSDGAIKQESDRSSIVTDEVITAISDFHDMAERREGNGCFAVESSFTGGMTKLPYGRYKFRTGKSPISGNGVFASSDIERGEIVGYAVINGGVTVLGCGVNHSPSPNVEFVDYCGGIAVVATRNIQGNKGGKWGEEILLNYRKSWGS